MLMRLDKYLAHYGLGTRKDVKKIIRKGLIKVNSNIVLQDDYKIDTEQDSIFYDDQEISYKQYVYLMMNKAPNCVCATKDNAHETVLDYIDYEYENYDLFPVGRLDKDTEGLLLITNDGDFAHKLMSPNRNHSKIYFARVQGRVNQEDIKAFKEGIILNNLACKSANLKVIKEDEISEVEVEVFEGKFHQVKRMFLERDKEVLYLKRLSIKDLKLDESLKPGEYRELSEDELNKLKDNL